MAYNNQKMTNLQLELLKLFSMKVSDNDLLEIKNLISNFFANKAMDEADKYWSENNMTDKDAEILAFQHLRSLSN